MKWIAVGSAVFLVAMGSAGAQPTPPPSYAPVPPPRAEVVPPPPGRGVVWEPGHWHWDGVRYEWRRGHYVDRRPGYDRYAEGRWLWAPREGRWIWRPARWE